MPEGINHRLIATYLEALKWRLQNELRGLHHSEARRDHQEMMKDVQEQIEALKAQEVRV